MKKIKILLFILMFLSSCYNDKVYEENYTIRGRTCHVLIPNRDKNGKWIIRPAFFKEYDYVDKELLKLGYHIVYYDVTDEYGNPKAQYDFEQFYITIRDKYHLNSKFIFEDFSRGGYFSLMYTISHPEQIEKIYLDAPVCDLFSWPKKMEPSLYDIDWLKPIRDKAMAWNQIKELSEHPLCTIGGHTVSHPALNLLSDEDFQKEIRLGVEKLESAICQKINHFAYPYGSANDIGEREYQLIKKFYFQTVFSAYGGCITENNKINFTHLPRVYLHE